MTAPSFSADVKFPSLPDDEIPEDRIALRTILAGQQGLEALYEKLEKGCGGESRFLTRLLRRDWKERFDQLLADGKELLRSMGCSERDLAETLPGSEQIEAIATSNKNAKPHWVASLLGAFASKALFCHELVPWKSDVEEVFEHFRKCLEAEDAHLAVLDLLCGLTENKR